MLTWWQSQNGQATAIAGFQIAAVVGEFSFVKLTAKAPGGLLIRMVSITTPTAAADTRVKIGTGSVTAATGAISYGIGKAVRAKLDRGTNAVTQVPASGGDAANFQMGSSAIPAVLNPLIIPPPLLWIPVNISIVFEAQLVNIALSGCILFTEVESE